MTLPVCKHETHYLTHRVPAKEDQCDGSLYVLVTVNDADLDRYVNLEELIYVKIKNAELVLRDLLKQVR